MSVGSALDALIKYYVDLLIIQYNNKPNARATIEALVSELLANNIYFDVRDGYDIETAIGHQLDILGKYADIDRYYKGQNFDGYFNFIIYDEVDDVPEDRIGFSDYTDFETKDGKWLIYPGTISEDYTLPDEDFRKLLKLRIIQNNSNHSHSEIDASIFATFGSEFRPDSIGNMIIDYFVDGDLTPLAIVASQKHVLPKPIGVRLGYFITENSPFFGFSTYVDGASEFIEGFANYSDYDTKDGEMLRNLKLLEA